MANDSEHMATEATHLEFCANCDAEATHLVHNQHESGRKFVTPLCYTCATAYE